MPPTGPADGRNRLAHPRGLWILTATELWDRISFHGMQALLTLYMVDYLLLPGHARGIAGFAPFRSMLESVTGPLSVAALAAQAFGIYTGLAYVAPVVGGALGDRLIGRRAGVISGGLLMAAGHFCLAFDATFLVALALLICGAGLFRGNIAPQVTALYRAGDPRQSDAFQIFYVGINLGAFIAPLMTGTLATLYGWHFGFGFAGVGMLLGVLIYLAGQRYLPAEDSSGAATVSHAPPATPALTRSDRRRLAGLAILFVVAVCFWITQSQVWNVYNLWVRDHVDLQVGGFSVPVPWLQSLDGLAPIIVLPLILAIWSRQAARGTEPDVLRKVATGCLLFAAGTVLLALTPHLAGAGRVPLVWPIAFHLITNYGWVYFTPTMEAIFAERSPPHLRGTLLGVNLASVFLASIISGSLGGLYETMSGTGFWLVHAGIVAAGALVIVVLGRPLRALLQVGVQPR